MFSKKTWAFLFVLAVVILILGCAIFWIREFSIETKPSVGQKETIYLPETYIHELVLCNVDGDGVDEIVAIGDQKLFVLEGDGTILLQQYSNNPYQLTSDDIPWLNISEVWFVLMEQETPGCPQLKTIMEIMNGSATENNYTHGKLIDILNSTSSNIIYYDNDDYNILSINDTFVVKSDAIPNNAQYMSFLLVYKGTCQNRYDSEIITRLGVTWWGVEV